MISQHTVYFGFRLEALDNLVISTVFSVSTKLCMTSAKLIRRLQDATNDKEQLAYLDTLVSAVRGHPFKLMRLRLRHRIVATVQIWTSEFGQQLNDHLDSDSNFDLMKMSKSDNYRSFFDWNRPFSMLFWLKLSIFMLFWLKDQKWLSKCWLNDQNCRNRSKMTKYFENDNKNVKIRWKLSKISSYSKILIRSETEFESD